ncbi:MAG TPA: hypothetical protein VHZ74_15705 [Bryobacteraceae bacterium]|nr:hypothetical protein [Bryobacteraceae bacterium]
MTPPTGTFLARVRNGVIQIPAPLKQYCDAAGWTLFRFTATGDDRLAMQPVLPDDPAADFHASLGPDGRLWIPADLRARVSLGEQSVMLRIEDGAIAMYLRKVFDTLGFRP